MARRSGRAVGPAPPRPLGRADLAALCDKDLDISLATPKRILAVMRRVSTDRADVVTLHRAEAAKESREAAGGNARGQSASAADRKLLRALEKASAGDDARPPYPPARSPVAVIAPLHRDASRELV